MNTKIEVKIKMDNGKKVVLNSEEARELMLKLQQIFSPSLTWCPTRYPVWYSDNTTITYSGGTK